jgi:hypothetical protein
VVNAAARLLAWLPTYRDSTSVLSDARELHHRLRALELRHRGWLAVAYGCRRKKRTDDRHARTTRLRSAPQHGTKRLVLARVEQGAAACEERLRQIKRT